MRTLWPQRRTRGLVRSPRETHGTVAALYVREAGPAHGIRCRPTLYSKQSKHNSPTIPQPDRRMLSPCSSSPRHRGVCGRRKPDGTPGWSGPRKSTPTRSACPVRRATSCLCPQCNQSGTGHKGGGRACRPHPGPVAASSVQIVSHSVGVLPKKNQFEPVRCLVEPLQIQWLWQAHRPGEGVWDSRCRDASARVCRRVLFRDFEPLMTGGDSRSVG